jgi:hypothetical protein
VPYNPNRTPRREIVAVVEEVMATAWQPPTETSEEALIKADAEAWRFAAEWERLSEQAESEGDRDAIWSIMAHANQLVEFITAAPVQSARTAAISMRYLLGGEEENAEHRGSRGIRECMVDEFHLAGFVRVLEWLERKASEERSAAAQLEPIGRLKFEGVQLTPETTLDQWLAFARSEFALKQLTAVIAGLNDEQLTEKVRNGDDPDTWLDLATNFANLEKRYESGASVCRAITARLFVALEREYGERGKEEDRA